MLNQVKGSNIGVYILVTSCPLVVGKIGCYVTRLLIIYVAQSEAHTDTERAFPEKYKYTSRLL